MLKAKRRKLKAIAYIYCTMEQSYNEMLASLRTKDNILQQVLDDATHAVTSSLDIDIYRSLLHSIVSQQLSTKVADVIWSRFLDLFDGSYPSMEEVLTIPIESLRGAGLSGQKSGYIKNVAEFASLNPMDFESLMDKSDEEIIAYLTQIKGVGRWTVQMILMFPMDRPDVFPVDDLGIQTKMKALYQIDDTGKALKKKLEAVAEKWSPYRTLACKYLWRHQLT